MTFFTPYSAHRRLDSDLFGDLERWLQPFHEGASANATDHEDHVLLSVDLPGFKQDEVKMEVLNRVLTVRAQSDRERKSGRKLQAYEQSFRLPLSIQADKIEAHFEDGVLDVFLPKKEEEKPHRIEIQSGKSSFFDRLVGSKEKTTEKPKELN